MNEQRIQELFNNEEFTEKFFATESAEAAKTLFKENGVDVSIDELNKVRDYIVNNADKIGEDGEMSLEALDDVAGGSVILKSIVTGIKIANKARKVVSVVNTVRNLFSGW